ncbi:hypothetical protein H0H93_011247 [Arthromyces matolae]|nr:hypothetical protein H0H93_011247 [Arthromyces matolae]
MAPKSSSTGKEKLIDDEEEVLQAVILADSFNKRFRPLTARKPRCLLPICNAPLLDWTFESLALAGVQEIFVVCRSHADQVKAAIRESKWSKAGSGIKIVPILTAKETFSPGDAMRDIYTRGLVTSDFVLVMGDLVSNIRIDEVVRVHKERRKTNKDAIMTMVVKESGARHRTKARGDSSIFVLDPETSECLYYEPVTAYPPTRLAHVPREIFAAHPELEIRNDLIDCSIDVCSVEVPSLFQDNFDYLDIRRDFVHGVLTSDLLMKNIHCYVAKDGYAARVKDTKSYESVSKDILSRWTFPLVPDDNHPSGHSYDHERGNKYFAKDHTVVLARYDQSPLPILPHTCKIGNNTMIGSSTQINENTEIISSVIGRNCIIGTGTIIRNSYIFDGTTVGSNCTIEQSIIGAGVSIRDDSIVQRGCLVGDGVIIGPSAQLEPYGRLSKRRDPAEIAAQEDEDEDSDIEDIEASQDSIPTTLGKSSNAIVWPTGPPEDAEEDDIAAFKNERFMRLGDDASDLDDSDDGSETSSSESESEEDSDFDSDAHSFTATSDASIPLNLPLESLMAETEFKDEVRQSLERAFAEGHSVDNAAVELKTLRMASNVPLTRVREAVVAAIVEKIQIVEANPAAQRKEIASVIGRWGELIDKIGGVDPIETVSVLQSHCATSQRLNLFGQILAALYQDDIVDEDDIRKWHSLPGSKGVGVKASDSVVEHLKKCWLIGAHMIKQFDEQESDEDSSEEDDPVEKQDKPKPEEEDGDADGEDPEDDEDEESSEDEEKISPTHAQQVKGEAISAAAEVSSPDESAEENSEEESEETESEAASRGDEFLEGDNNQDDVRAPPHSTQDIRATAASNASAVDESSVDDSEEESGETESEVESKTDEIVGEGSSKDKVKGFPALDSHEATTTVPSSTEPSVDGSDEESGETESEVESREENPIQSSKQTAVPSKEPVVDAGSKEDSTVDVGTRKAAREDSEEEESEGDSVEGV